MSLRRSSSCASGRSWSKERPPRLPTAQGIRSRRHPASRRREAFLVVAVSSQWTRTARGRKADEARGRGWRSLTACAVVVGAPLRCWRCCNRRASACLRSCEPSSGARWGEDEREGEELRWGGRGRGECRVASWLVLAESERGRMRGWTKSRPHQPHLYLSSDSRSSRLLPFIPNSSSTPTCSRISADRPRSPPPSRRISSSSRPHFIPIRVLKCVLSSCIPTLPLH